MSARNILFLLFLACATLGHAMSKADAEAKLQTADDLWQKGSPGKALPIYEELLTKLPKDCEPFRATVITRVARAQFWPNMC